MRDKDGLFLEEVYRIFETRGPASAYDYIQRAGFDAFPPTLVASIRQHVRAKCKRGSTQAPTVFR